MVKPKKLLYIDSKAKYSQIEQKHLKRKVIKDESFDFSKLEVNHIVPMRNIFYILRATEYSEDIYLGVTYYDLHIDKRPDVLIGLQNFINTYYGYREPPKAWKRPFCRIHTPFRDITKGELLSLVIEKDKRYIKHFQNLRTCYSPTSEKGCGRCKSCVHKAIALAVNDIFSPEFFDEDPRKVHSEWSEMYAAAAEGTIDVNIFKNELKKLIEW